MRETPFSGQLVGPLEAHTWGLEQVEGHATVRTRKSRSCKAAGLGDRIFAHVLM